MSSPNRLSCRKESYYQIIDYITNKYKDVAPEDEDVIDLNSLTIVQNKGFIRKLVQKERNVWISKTGGSADGYQTEEETYLEDDADVVDDPEEGRGFVKVGLRGLVCDVIELGLQKDKLERSKRHKEFSRLANKQRPQSRCHEESLANKKPPAKRRRVEFVTIKNPDSIPDDPLIALISSPSCGKKQLPFVRERSKDIMKDETLSPATSTSLLFSQLHLNSPRSRSQKKLSFTNPEGPRHKTLTSTPLLRKIRNAEPEEQLEAKHSYNDHSELSASYHRSNAISPVALHRRYDLSDRYYIGKALSISPRHSSSQGHLVTARQGSSANKTVMASLPNRGTITHKALSFPEGKAALNDSSKSSIAGNLSSDSVSFQHQSRSYHSYSEPSENDSLESGSTCNRSLETSSNHSKSAENFSTCSMIVGRSFTRSRSLESLSSSSMFVSSGSSHRNSIENASLNRDSASGLSFYDG